MKSLGEYHYQYLRKDVLRLTNIFENFRSMYFEIFELDPAKFISALRLAWHAALRKIGVKLDLLTDIDML